MGVMADPLPADGRLLESSAAAGIADFTALVLAEQKRIFLLCRRMLQDAEEADSAAQDTFLKAHRALAGTAAVAEPGKWLTRIAINTCLDRLRSRRWQFWRRRPDPENERLILNQAVDTRPGPEACLYARQVAQRLAAALDRLSARQRAVFTLRHYEDLSLEEIGELLGLNNGTVKAHLFRALAKLRKELRDFYTGPQGEGRT